MLTESVGYGKVVGMETSKKTTVKRAKPQPTKVEPGVEQVLQFKLTLDDFKPRIWRRVQVSSQTTMLQFAHVVMELFHMENAHLYAFTFPETKGMLPKSNDPFAYPCVRIELFADGDWNEPDGERLFDVEDPSLTLAAVLDRFPCKKIEFEYDYGDDWGVTILFEKVLAKDAKAAAKELPCVLKGEGYGIVEDCGGLWGLAQLIDLVHRRATNQPIEDTGYDEPLRLKWLDDLFPEAAEALLTPEAFDIDAANEAIRPMIFHASWD